MPYIGQMIIDCWSKRFLNHASQKDSDKENDWIWWENN